MNIKELRKKAMESIASDDDVFFHCNTFKNFLSLIVEGATKRYGRQLKVNIMSNAGDNITAFTDGEGVHVNPSNGLIKNLTRPERYKAIIGHTIHEAGHIIWTDFVNLRYNLKQFLKDGTFFIEPSEKKLYDEYRSFLATVDEKDKSVYNMMLYRIYDSIMQPIEDGYVDARICTAFPGYGKNRIYIRERMYDETEALDPASQEDTISIILHMVFFRGKFGKLKGTVTDPDALAVNGEIEPIIAKAVVEKNSPARISLCEDVFLHVFHYMYEKGLLQAMPQIPQQSSGDSDTGDGEDQQGSNGQSSDGSDTDDGEDQQGSNGQSSGGSDTGDGEDQQGSNGQSSDGSDTDDGEDQQGSNGQSSSGSDTGDGKDQQGSNGQSSGGSDTGDGKDQQGSNGQSSSGSDTGDGEDQQGSNGQSSSGSDTGDGEDQQGSNGQSSSGSDTGDGEDQQGSNGQSSGSANVDPEELLKAIAQMLSQVKPYEDDEETMPEDINTLPVDYGEEEGTEKVSEPENKSSSSSSNGDDGTEKTLATLAKQAAQETVGKAVENMICDELRKSLDEAGQSSESEFPARMYRQNPTGCVIPNEYKPYSKRIQSMLKQIIKDMEDESVEHGLYVGTRLDTRMLSDPNSGDMCKNAIPEDAPSMAVTVLIDRSGSMAGEKLDAAKETALLVYDFCYGMEIPVAVYAHDEDYGNDVQIISVAEFDSIDGKDMDRIMSLEEGCCNRDGYAIRFAGKRLMDRPEIIHLLFIISDGLPNGYGYCGQAAISDVRKAVSDLRKKGCIVITAGIGDSREDIGKVYLDGESKNRSAQFLDISDLSTMPRTFVKIIEKNLLR